MDEERKSAQDSPPVVDLRRVYTMPSRSLDSVNVVLRPSQSADGPIAHKLDRFGFILNMDSNGNLLQPNDVEDDHHSVPGFADNQRTIRRTRKWTKMTDKWPTVLRRRHRLVTRRLRKGVPDAMRGQVWSLLGNIDEKKKKHVGLYDKLVRETIIDDPVEQMQLNHTKSFRNLQDTIERDIHRTFPRHAMFYDDVSESASERDEPMCGSTKEISDMLRELELTTPASSSPRSRGGGRLSPVSVLEGKGGQASLRRVLKAYSLYDREIGYCQGMNFIAGMFLTLLSEEDSFWLLVAVMYDDPCRMRGLFGEGMRETHQVLYVAEKLIHQFLPRLGKHLEREHVHITMFATQWLLTQYTSSFRFDLVMRVWDCFLNEGWKSTYRVMLALLTEWQPALLKMSFEEILAFFRELPNRVEGAKVVDAAIKIPLRRKHIEKYEKEWLAQHPAPAK